MSRVLLCAAAELLVCHGCSVHRRRAGYRSEAGSWTSGSFAGFAERKCPHPAFSRCVLFCRWFCCEVCQLHPAVIMIVGTELLLLRGAPHSGAESFVPATLFHPYINFKFNKHTICKQTMVSAAEGASHTAVRNAIVVFSLGCVCPRMFHCVFVSLFSCHILDSGFALQLSILFLVRFLPAPWLRHTYR